MACFPYFMFGKKASSDGRRDPEIVQGFLGIRIKVYTYGELKTASNNFSPANKIGAGAYGAVYKGLLKDGKLAAIKVLPYEFHLEAKEFLAEVNVISKIQHDNLVELNGCCVEGEHRILIYNYLENNSLAQTLLGGGQSNIYFDWQTRCRICIGVARGLAFLHEQVQPYHIHRKLTCSNILLDKDLTPKISNFGLAKLKESDIHRRRIKIARGTMCHIAPEYGSTGHLTRKSDVYSFGVLLVEIVSGESNRSILQQTWKLYEQKELLQLVDTSLNRELCAEEASKYLKIALLCTQITPKLRPTMSEVLKMLTGEMDVNESKITRPGLVSDVL